MAVGLLLCPLAGCGRLARDDNARGVQLYQQGNYRGAVSHFQRALARRPGSPDCFYNLGATYHQQAKVFGQTTDWRSAEQYYHLCLARSPDHEACRRGLANLLVEQKRSPEAVALLEDWSRRQPSDPAPRLELARLSDDHGDRAEAERHLAAALAIDPSNPRALEALGRARSAAIDGAAPAAPTGVDSVPAATQAPAATLVVAGVPFDARAAATPSGGEVMPVSFATGTSASYPVVTASTFSGASAPPLTPPQPAAPLPAR